MNTFVSERTIMIRRAKAWEDPTLDELVRSLPGASVYHLSPWRRLIRSLFGHETHVLVAEQNGTLIGMLPLVRLRSMLFGDYMVSMPYFNYGGPIGSSRNVEEQLMTAAAELADELGVRHVEFRDIEPRSDVWSLRTDKVAMILPLPRDPDELWKSIGTKKRTRIRHPLKEGALVRHGGPELLDDFYEVFARNMRDLGTPVYSKRFFSEILHAFPRDTSITSVRVKGHPVAAGFLVGHKNKMEIPWASSTREANRLAVNMLLYWEILKRSIEEGYQVFDFGRSTVGGGTYAFKKQWGAAEHQLYWHYWLREGEELPSLTPSNPKYAMAIKVWRKLPLAVTRWLGPAVVKNLP